MYIYKKSILCLFSDCLRNTECMGVINNPMLNAASTGNCSNIRCVTDYLTCFDGKEENYFVCGFC